MTKSGTRTSRAFPAVTEDDTVEIELAELYTEREKLSFAAPKTTIQAERVREHRNRIDTQIARLEAMRA